jgi:hypothetical protein
MAWVGLDFLTIGYIKFLSTKIGLSYHPAAYHHVPVAYTFHVYIRLLGASLNRQSLQFYSDLLRLTVLRRAFTI